MAGEIPTETIRLAAAIEQLSKSIDRLDTEIRTLRSDARSDFRVLFGTVITTAVGLAAMIAKVGALVLSALVIGVFVATSAITILVA